MLRIKPIEDAVNLLRSSASHMMRTAVGLVSSPAELLARGKQRRVVFVRREESTEFVKVSSDGPHVADLVAAAAARLHVTEALDTLALKPVASAFNGCEVASDGTLDSTSTLDEAGVQQLARLELTQRGVVELTLRWEQKKGRGPITTVKVRSNAEYTQLLQQGRMLFLCRRGKGVSVQQTPLLTLASAVEAKAVLAMDKDAYLLLCDPFVILQSDVSNLKSYRRNAATSFEVLATRSLACSTELSAAYGGSLTPLNNGHHIIFTETATNNDFLECDGLVTNTSVLLVNEGSAGSHGAGSTHSH